MNKRLLMTFALLCAVAQGLVLTACSSDNDNDDNVELPETDAYNVFDDLGYFQNAIVETDSLDNFLYYHYGEELYPNDKGHLYIGVDTWDEAEKMFRAWIAPDVTLSNTAPSTKSLQGSFTDEQGKAQLTAFLKPGEGNIVAECTVSDESQLKHFNQVTFLLNSTWPHNSGENIYHVGDLVLGMDIHDRGCDLYEYGYDESFCDCINSYLHEKDKRLNFVCLREQSNGVKPLFAAITSHDGYKCGGDLYPAHCNICNSDYTPNESEAGSIRSLLTSNWSFFVDAFKDAGFGPLTEDCDYFIDRWHFGGFLNLVTYYDTYSYKTGYINGIMIGGSRRFLLYFDNYSDEDLDDFMTLYR